MYPVLYDDVHDIIFVASQLTIELCEKPCDSITEYRLQIVGTGFRHVLFMNESRDKVTYVQQQIFRDLIDYGCCTLSECLPED